jgi:acetate kinase
MSTVAVVNAGSSSLKFAIFQSGDVPSLRLKGLIDGIGATPRLRLTDAAGAVLLAETPDAAAFNHAAATRAMMRVVAPWLDGDIRAVGHRVVHGGGEFAAPARVTPAILERLESFIPLAPLHQPHNLAVIRALLAGHPELPQIACFDTAFHRTAPPIAQAFALPRRFAEAGVRRYGFHGLSYQYVAGRLAEVAPHVAKGRVIIAHLGNGASLCALRDGRSIATTMGFTAVDGLMMGTRCGALDPGVMLYLMDEHRMGARELEALIYRQSGLLGVSGVSSDMRTLRASCDPAAREAIDLFVYRILREIGSLAAALGGLDALVFTAGIGENDAMTRAEVVDGCAWLGAALDRQANDDGNARISAQASRVEVLVIPTNEELEIARDVWRLAADRPAA